MKKKHIDQLQNDIMWLLEEACEETVGTIFNTLRPSNNRSPREAFESKIDQAIAGLIRECLVEFETINKTNRQLRVGINEILKDFDGNASSLVECDSNNFWSSVEIDPMFETVSLALTDKGMKFFDNYKEINL